MKTIGELLARDLGKKIEEIIQVDQADEQSVYAEITEYIATDSIRDQYATLFKAIAEAPLNPMKQSAFGYRAFLAQAKVRSPRTAVTPSKTPASAASNSPRCSRSRSTISG